MIRVVELILEPIAGIAVYRENDFTLRLMIKYADGGIDERFIQGGYTDGKVYYID